MQEPSDQATIRPGWRASVFERARQADPVPVATDSDVMSRWPEGRRTVLSVQALLGIGLLVLLAMLALLGRALPLQLALGIGAGAGALVLGAVTWFLPIGTPTVRPIEQIQIGEWVVVGGRPLLPHVSAVILSAWVTLLDGSDFRIGTQLGSLVGRSRQPEIAVVEINDVWRKLRIPFIPDDLGNEPNWLVPLGNAIREHRSQGIRSVNWSAPVDEVKGDLIAQGMPSDLWIPVVSIARTMGLLDRRLDNISLIDVSLAGHAWVEFSNEVSHTGEDGQDGETTDLPSLVRTILDEAVAHLAPLPRVIQPWDFNDWVGTLIRRFKTAVEDRAAYRAMWAGDKRQGETEIQAIAYEIFREPCLAAGVIQTKESNAGNGPVDFLFSLDAAHAVPVEFKVMDNPQLFHGASRQLPRYMQAEGATCGYYVCIGFRDADFAAGKVQLINDACADARTNLGLDVRPIIVDARKRPSASKW